MSLTHDAAPAGAHRMIGEAIAELVGHGALAMGRRTTPTASTPVRLFHLGADAIASGKGLAGAVPVGWLATVSNGSEVIGSVELTDAPAPRGKGRAKTAAPGSLRFASFTAGPLHAGLGSQLKQAASRARTKDVHVSVLRAPAVYLFALWLSDGDEDTLVPIAPAPPPLEAGKAIAADEALARLARAAKSAVASTRARS